VRRIRLADLKEVEPQKERCCATPRSSSPAGRPTTCCSPARGHRQELADQGLLNEFAPQGLRLIEVDKADLVDLPDLVDLVAAGPSASSSSATTSASTRASPATRRSSPSSTARWRGQRQRADLRHQQPPPPAARDMKDNLSYQHTEDGEVHPGEVVEEKISLSERFGLWISFYPFSQDEYLAIVAQWLRTSAGRRRHRRGAPELVWALERGSRSGRVAFQFAKDCRKAPRVSERRTHAGRCGRRAC
jgi:predicted AAA+ superfamily ATPase